MIENIENISYRGETSIVIHGLLQSEVVNLEMADNDGQWTINNVTSKSLLFAERNISSPRELSVRCLWCDLVA